VTTSVTNSANQCGACRWPWPNNNNDNNYNSKIPNNNNHHHTSNKQQPKSNGQTTRNLGSPISVGLIGLRTKRHHFIFSRRVALSCTKPAVDTSTLFSPTTPHHLKYIHHRTQVVFIQRTNCWKWDWFSRHGYVVVIDQVVFHPKNGRLEVVACFPPW
jgi:hypothetical protein